NSLTYDVDRSAPSRSSATVAAASSAVTCGPAPASRDPIETASSQSTISVVIPGAYVPPKWELSAPEAIGGAQQRQVASADARRSRAARVSSVSAYFTWLLTN